MDALEFVAALVDSLAWPVTSLTICIVFRKQIASQFGRLSRFKAAGVEAEFAAELSQVVRKTDELAESSSVAASALAESLPPVEPPRLTVLSAWQALDEGLRFVAASSGLDASSPISVLLNSLRERGRLTTLDVDLLSDLHRLRNSVAHDDVPVSHEAATTYADAAQRLAAALRSSI